MRLLPLFLLAAACASGGTHRNGGENPNLISIAEVRGSSASNAFQLVQELHPEWLWRRGQQSMGENESGEIVVYFENARMGGPNALRQIPTVTITTVQFFDARSAQYRWGAGHTHGAILVLSGAQD